MKTLTKVRLLRCSSAWTWAGLALAAALLTGCPPPSDAPRAAFRAEPVEGPAELRVQFTDRSQPGASSIEAWQWTFGDGSTSTERHPEHTYLEPGSYTVSLHITTETGSHRREQPDYIRVLDPDEIEGEPEGEGEEPGEPNVVSGHYNPDLELRLEVDGLRLVVPPGALVNPTTISMYRARVADMPRLLPGGLSLAGGVFAPSGTEFNVPATAQVALLFPTLARALPVLIYDEDRGAWVGTGAVAEVSPLGEVAQFLAPHFSMIGVPEALPLPPPGGPLPIGVTGMGELETEWIASDTAWLNYSATGNTFQLTATEQRLDEQNRLVTVQLGLHSAVLFEVENYLIGAISGADSSYSEGSSPEPAVGVMILSMDVREARVTLYVATPERVIHGTFHGRM